MSDQGRPLADFQSSTRRDEYIKYVNDITRDDQYRLFLQSNGKEILDREWNYYTKNASCWTSDCIHVYPTRSTPQQYWQERAAYDSIYDVNTHAKMAPYRQCIKRQDYRMSP